MKKLLLTGLMAVALTWLPAPALAETPLSVKVVAEPAQVKTLLGDRFMITTEITNTSATPSGEILAHLNVASIEGSVYVDPEDWSPSRSQQLSLDPGESRKLSWELQAVNSGHFAAYVVVVPFGSTVAGNEELLISPLVNVTVASRGFLRCPPSRLKSIKPDSMVRLPNPQAVPEQGDSGEAAPAVSVIIATYNAGPLLGHALDALARVHDFIRTRVPELEHDRPPSRDLAVITELIASGDLERACPLIVN